MNTTSKPPAVTIAQVLLFLIAAIWLVLDVATLVRMDLGASTQAITALVVGTLMLGNVAALLVAGVGIGTRRRPFCYLALAVLLVNILLTFTDEVGVVDVVTVLLDFALFGLLIVTRSHYVAGRA